MYGDQATINAAILTAQRHLCAALRCAFAPPESSRDAATGHDHVDAAISAIEQAERVGAETRERGGGAMTHIDRSIGSEAVRDCLAEMQAKTQANIKRQREAERDAATNGHYTSTHNGLVYTGHRVGLVAGMTPAQAREFARQIARAADEAAGYPAGDRYIIAAEFDR